MVCSLLQSLLDCTASVTEHGAYSKVPHALDTAVHAVIYSKSLSKVRDRVG